MIIHRVIDRLWFSQQEPPIDQEVLWLSRVSEGYELKVYDDGDWRVINWPGDIFVDIEIDENGDLIINGEVVGHVTGEDGQDGQNGIDGQDGQDGQDATIENVTATVGSSTGTPSVQVTMGGTPSHRTIHFAFDGLKGAQGLPGQNGQNGAQGPQGEPGQDGQDGQDGRDGTMWYTGTELTQPGTFVIPDSNIGDLYFNTSTYDLYQQVSANQWIWLCNLQGPPGSGGGGGGGHDGSTWYFGNDITGTGAISYYIQGAQIGDLYLNVDTLELYQAQSGNVWQYICTLGNVYTAGEGIDITDNVISNTLADDTHIGGIRAMQNPNPHAERIGMEVMFGNGAVVDAYYGRSVDEKHLCIGVEQLWAVLNWQDEYTEPMFRSGFGIQPHAWHEYNTHTGVYDDWYTFDLIHGIDDYGKILKIADDGSGIEWISIPTGGQSYDPLSINSVYGTNYVVAAPAKPGGYLRWDGIFDMPPSNVSINPILHTGVAIAEYTIDNDRGYIYAPNSGSNYSAGDGIWIDGSNYINIDTTGASNGWVLGYNSSIPGVEWVPQTSYTAGVGINIDNTEKKIEARIMNN